MLRAVLPLPFSETLCRSLSVAGVDGTLKHRLKRTEAEGRVWAKTGTLRNASALAGYALTADGEPLVFAVLSFGKIARAKAVEDSLVAALARFSFCGAAAQSE